MEALLWVLGIESGCELRVFENTPNKPTMQVQSLGVFDAFVVASILCPFLFVEGGHTINAGIYSAKA